MYKTYNQSLLFCSPLSSNVNDPEAYQIAIVFALFYFQKYLEFLDTWFFLLRKSLRQVTFTHIAHHSSITMVIGLALPFDYNGDLYLIILLNSVNHVLVYVHYILATVGIQSWWANYISFVQLFQFCLIFAHSSLAYRIGPTCGSPDFIKVMLIAYSGGMVTLLGNFLLQKYVLKRVSVIDIVGLLKRPQANLVNTTTEYYGTVILNELGSATVELPEHFPDAELISRLSFIRGSLTGLPFGVNYNLTAIGNTMPDLHIAKEVGREYPDQEKHTQSHQKPTQTFHSNKKRKEKEGKQRKVNTQHHKDREKEFEKDDEIGHSLSRESEFDPKVRGISHDRIIDGPLPQIIGEGGIIEKVSSLLTDPLNPNVTEPKKNASKSMSRKTRDSVNETIVDNNVMGMSNKLDSPLTFRIGGGSRNGKVSWMLTTVPSALTIHTQQKLASIKRDTNEVEFVSRIERSTSFDSLSLDGSIADEHEEDWRAIS